MIITGFAYLLIIGGWCEVGYSTLPCYCWSPESETMIDCHDGNAMLPPSIAIAVESGDKKSTLTSSDASWHRRTCFAFVLPDFSVNKNQGHLTSPQSMTSYFWSCQSKWLMRIHRLLTNYPQPEGTLENRIFLSSFLFKVTMNWIIWSIEQYTRYMARLLLIVMILNWKSLGQRRERTWFWTTLAVKLALLLVTYYLLSQPIIITQGGFWLNDGLLHFPTTRNRKKILLCKDKRRYCCPKKKLIHTNSL